MASGRTALHIAAETGDLEEVQHLLCRGADVNEPDVQGYPPLFYAASQGHNDVIEQLISYKADPNYNNRLDGQTPLFRVRLTHLHSEFLSKILSATFILLKITWE